MRNNRMKNIHHMSIVKTSLIFILLKTSYAQYYFKNAEDLEACERVEFIEISPYRKVSLTQMAWQSAHGCCKMKGSLLHTIERSVESMEYPLYDILLKKFGKEAEDMQFWVGLSLHKGNFRWSFGSVLKHSSVKINNETYRWVDGHPEIERAARCVAISPYREILEMRAVACNTKLNFICQKIPRLGGEPLTAIDMMTVGSAQFIEIPGFENLKFSTTFARWPVANAICQSRNWALINRVHERYGDKLAVIIQKPKYMLKNTSKVIHTGGNDFCESSKWQWACGEKLQGIIPWTSATSESNKSESFEHCLQYTVVPAENSSSTIMARNVGCNEYGYTICDTTPSCSVGDQYRCLYKDPYYVDFEAEAKTEKDDCKRMKFYPWNDSKNTSYWISTYKFTWFGAVNCCKSKGLNTVAPKSSQELQLLQRSLLDANISIWEDEMQYDGYWTSTSTRGYLPHSPLRFLDGRLLSRNLYSSIRADGFSSPSCGRINYMNFEMSQSNYAYADCLEKNIFVCVESAKKEHIIQERKALDVFEQLDEFDQKVFEKFFVMPNEEELDLRLSDYSRDYCRNVDIHNQYSEGCLGSATKVEHNLKSTRHIEFSDNAKMEVPFQDKRILLEQLIINAFYLSNETESFQSYGFQFLNKSANLFMEFCPLVPQSFITFALKMFYKLHQSLSPERQPEIISKVHFDWAMKLLDQCKTYMKPVEIKHDNCGDLMMTEKTCDNFICTDPKFEFNLQTDILLDIIWKIFETIHSACFPAFKQNTMLHHKYAMVITDLWGSEGIRLRWPHQMATKKFWKRFLGPFFELHALNIERCSTATIANSYFHVRLPRHTVPRTVRMTGFAYEKLNSYNNDSDSTNADDDAASD